MLQHNAIAVARITCALIVLVTSASAASKERVLHNFSSGKGGHSPIQGVIFDGAGNVYGVTTYGGNHENGGTVYKLSQGPNGSWTETVLYDFCSVENCVDGAGPFGNLIFDGAGNLYGTTVGGGTAEGGTVFELTPDGNGAWTETVLHSFTGEPQDGFAPYAGVIMDTDGNVYGTTSVGGASGAGIAFELSTAGNGSWTETVLHNFCSAPHCADGMNPYGGLTLDAAGVLYGMTYQGGDADQGAVFELSRNNGTWQETVLQSFDGTDGAGPEGDLIFDSAGNLFGATAYGGDMACDKPVGCGAIFELQQANNKWTESVLHVFYVYPKNPSSTLVFDSSGNLYGTTLSGGEYGGGVLFKLTKAQNGTWATTAVFSFREPLGDDPVGFLTFDSSGNLYGSAQNGGKFNNCYQACGVIFEITP